MDFTIVSLFPDFFQCFFKTGLRSKGIQLGIVSYTIENLRAYGKGSYKSVDDRPFGGGNGMILQKTVLAEAFEKIKNKGPKIFLSPRGKPLSQSMAKQLSSLESISILCGQYEGVDQRFIESHIDQEISIGDYIILGGESAACVLIESIIRLLPGLLGNSDSAETESFIENVLEYDQYTRPTGKDIPSVLLSGNHAEIALWRQQNSLQNTYLRRIDLFKQLSLSKQDQAFIKKFVAQKYSFK